MSRVTAQAIALAFLMVWLATPAHAELVVFSSGRTMSIKDYRVEGTTLVLMLRGGGEVSCDPSMIDRIDPDEVPYPEPADEMALRLTDDEPASGPYAEMIQAIATEHGVDPRLVRAVIQVESAFRRDARSRKGAMGLMQLMPQMARSYRIDNPYDPRSNIEGGIKYLKSLLLQYELPIALAAYNAGETAIRRFGGIPPFRETRAYVTRVLQLFQPPAS
ncbi:MAG: lytic transglycosylase domain-containing protein [Acidobacteria bacterium]|nr:lytic transglycosylase domain-containing protein [Acidobacteriota bacterium]